MSLRKYRLVKQRSEWACGVACVASALGIPYDQATERLEAYKCERIDALPYGLELEPIIQVMQDAGIVLTVETGSRRWPLGTIVFLSETRGRYKDGGHYLLRSPDGWMDPWVNYPEEPRQSAYRERLPYGTSVQVALVPKQKCEVQQIVKR